MRTFKITFVLLISIFVAKCHDEEEDFNTRLIALQNLVKSQGVKIISLEEKVSDLTEKVIAQDNDKTKMEAELLEFKRNSHKHNVMIKRLVKLVKRKDEVKDKLDGEKDKEVDRKFDIKKRFVLDTLETVAFEATMAGGKLDHNTHINDKIVFETVSLNVGNGYKTRNGTFIAPVSGIYIFSTSVMMTATSSTDHEMHVIIEKNNAEVAGAYANNQGGYEHSSVTAAMDLNAGDSVAVTVERHDGVTFYGDNLSSFMGFLLYAF